jgi:hypothetical protein
MSGGPLDLGRLSISGAAGAAGGAAGDDNLVVNNPNGQAPRNTIMFGDKAEGALRYSEFKIKMTPIFQLNSATGCIFAAAANSKAVLSFYDELYLSYLLFFKANPLCYNTVALLHERLFDAQNNYSYFKHFIVFPNLVHKGIHGFPEDMGVKQGVATNWLKYYA